MPIRKLRELGSSTIGVSLPKDDLRLEGLVDEDGNLQRDQEVVIQRTEEGGWELELVDEERFPHLAD